MLLQQEYVYDTARVAAVVVVVQESTKKNKKKKYPPLHPIHPIPPLPKKDEPYLKPLNNQHPPPSLNSFFQRDGFFLAQEILLWIFVVLGFVWSWSCFSATSRARPTNAKRPRHIAHRLGTLHDAVG